MTSTKGPMGSAVPVAGKAVRRVTSRPGMEPQPQV